MSTSVREARPYQVIELEYRGPGRLLDVDPGGDRASKGLSAVLESRTSGGWRPVHRLVSSVWGERIPVACPYVDGEDPAPFVAVPLGAPEEVIVPAVPSGVYRIRKEAYFEERTVVYTARLRVVADRPPAAADVNQAEAQARQSCRTE